MQALGNHHASEEELSELKKLIQQLEEDKQQFMKKLF
jgi:hypothetical protein